MPNGQTHNAINLGALAGVTVAAIAARADIPAAPAITGTLAYLAGTFYLSPDLDLSNTVRTASKRAWGRLGFLWVPYGWIFKHRGVSHSWIVGPFTRIAYLFILATLIAGLFAPLANLEVPAMRALTSSFERGITQVSGAASVRAEVLPMLCSITLGYLLSQWMHLLADGIKPDRL